MDKLLWFHAFNRNGVVDIIDVFVKGAFVHPDPGNGTRVNEVALGISPHCVYAYLGRTLELFGANAAVLGLNDLIGTVSPFDTGGLVRRIEPVCQWPVPQKQDFLREYSWPTSALASLLQKYPSEAELRPYLAAKKPAGAGPGDMLRASGSKHAPPLWAANDDWRAWTWEGRSAQSLDLGGLRAWTCAPALLPDLRAHTATLPDTVFVRNLWTRYHHGGVANLVRSLRDGQAT